MNNSANIFSYDDSGNITLFKFCFYAAEGSDPRIIYSINYGYTNSSWGDLLTSYSGNTITYDEIGNPLTYRNGFAFTWTGRQLTGATKGSNAYSYTYNDEGIRTSKTKNGVTTTYYLNGSQIIAEDEIIYFAVKIGWDE